jgi:hypothetical protein
MDISMSIWMRRSVSLGKPLQAASGKNETTRATEQAIG